MYFMKKGKLIIILTVVLSLFFFLSCEDSGSSGDVNDATSLGSSLVLSGIVDKTFITSTKTLNDGYTNATSLDFRLYDESDNTTYGIDDNTGGNVNVDFDYDGSSPVPSVYSSSGWTGITSSNPAANITSAVIDIDTTSDDIVYGNFETLPAEWYYYMYSTAETIMNGTYVDTDESPVENHIYDNIRIFEGWNRLRKITSDGETFTYTGGDISGGHWTYMDNS
jgi:hypothetical protein